MRSDSRRREERAAPQGPPPFAGIEPPERRCSCPECPVPGGAVLSRFNNDPDGLCYQCREAGRLPGMQHLVGSAAEDTPVELHEVVAGLLLLQRNLRPDEPVQLRQALGSLGIVATKLEIKNAVRRCRRRNMEIETSPGQAGYTLAGWCAGVVDGAGEGEG